MDPIPPDINKTQESQYPLGTKLEKEITLKSGESIILPSIQIEKLRLFHGSPTSGIKEFIDAEETTIGNGFYTTSDRNAAIGYSVVRSDKSQNRILYEIEITDMNIVDLTRQDSMDLFARLFREKLSELLPRIKADNEVVKWWTQEKIRQTVEMIDSKKYRGLKDICQGFGDLTRQTLKDLGYDGLIAMEGGEAGNGISIGRHDSYVIFDPTKAKVISEEPAVLNTVV